MVEILQLTEASEGALADINRLLPQLRAHPSEHTGTMEELRTIVADGNVALVVAKDGEKIVGMATLYVIEKFSKRVGCVEDVVVDADYRGQGLGEKIMREVLDIARAGGLLTVNLTSRPERTAGNKLYQKLGFEHKHTNVYRLKL